MAVPSSQDKRLLERAQRRGEISAQEVDQQAGELPDLSDRIATPSDEELQELRQELLDEHEARSQRIERFIEEGPLPEIRPTPPPAPLDDSEI